MFATPQEVKALTGYSQTKKQASWLREQGFKFAVGADNKVKVLKDHISSKLDTGRKTKAQKQPDFSIFEA